MNPPWRQVRSSARRAGIGACSRGLVYDTRATRSPTTFLDYSSRRRTPRCPESRSSTSRTCRPPPPAATAWLAGDRRAPQRRGRPLGSRRSACRSAEGDEYSAGSRHYLRARGIGQGLTSTSTRSDHSVPSSTRHLTGRRSSTADSNTIFVVLRDELGVLARRTRPCRAVVLTARPGAFCVRRDVTSMKPAMVAAESAATRWISVRHGGSGAAARMRRSPSAAVNGPCAVPALVRVRLCDLRYARASAVFRSAFFFFFFPCASASSGLPLPARWCLTQARPARQSARSFFLATARRRRAAASDW